MNGNGKLAMTLTVAGAVLAAAGCMAAPPNFLVILADDLASNELGCYGGVNVATPAIDRLASEGTRFTRAFASEAMCVPLRASLYTGLFPARHGVYRNHAPTRLGTQSVVQYLEPLGYRVGLTGKLHAQPKTVYPFEIVPGFEPDCVKATADYTLDGIREFIAREPAKPFCLFVCSTLPHAPWTAGDASKFDAGKLALPPIWADTAHTRAAFAKYCAEVALLDKQVADVLGALDAAGRRGDTLVLFCGEQGPQFPGGKWTLYDHGVHTAFIARWPGKVGAGAVSDAIVQYEDVVPTFIQAGGGTPPGELDGMSFLGVLRGEKAAHRECAFGIHNNAPEGPPYPIRSVRTAEYKLILNLTPAREYIEKHLMQIDREDYWHSWVSAAATDERAARMVARYMKRPGVELYDVRKDPWEMENLAERAELKGVRAELEQRLRAWMSQQGDPGAAMDVELPPKSGAKKARPAP